MSIELVGFENLPNAFIKDVSITNSGARLDSYKVTIKVHDLPDRSIWSSTEELLFKLMRVGLIFATDTQIISELSNGETSPTSLNYMSKAISVEPIITEESAEFELTFIHKMASNIANLTVFAFCFISKKDTSDALGITMSTDYVGPIKSEKIIESQNVVATTNVFLRPDGSYWPGPVHEHNGTFMEGSYHTSRAHNILTRRILTNAKIKDKRQITETAQGGIKGTENYISDLFVSYSSDTDINSMFMINMKTLLLKNTRFGKFIDKASQSVMSSLLSRLSIRMLSIQRQRIKPSYRRMSVGAAKRRADMVFSRKNILNTQDGGSRRILEKTRLERKGSFDVLPGDVEDPADYKKICDIQELFFEYGQDIRCFQFTDYELNPKTPGDYQYKIELQLADPVDRFLRDATTILKSDIGELIDYGTIFSRRGSSATVAAERIVNNYLDHYSYVYQLGMSMRDKMFLKYLNMLNPATANMSSISKFTKVYRDLYTEFVTFLEYDDQKRVNVPISIMAKERTSRRIMIENIFHEIVTPSENSLAFSYLPENSDKKTAVYTKSAFMEQSQEQVEAEFVTAPNFDSVQTPIGVNSAVSDIQTTKTSYFSPSNYQIDGQQVRMRNVNTMGLNRLNNTIFRNILEKSRKPQAALSKKYEVSPVFLTVERVGAPMQDTEDSQFIESDEILGAGHEFVSYSESSEDFNKPSVVTNSQQKFRSKLSGYNSRTFNATLEALKDITTEEAEVLPNQLKSVINGISDSTRSNFISNGNDLLANPTTKNYYELKNFSVKEVIYVDRFEEDSNGNVLLNKPVYKTLLFNEFQRLDKPALCFLRDYTNEKFNITGETKVQAINSVFVISDRDITVPSEQVVSTPQSIYTAQDIEYQFMRSNIVNQSNAPITLTEPPETTPSTDITITSAPAAPAVTMQPTTTFGSY